MQQEALENVLEALGASDVKYTGNGYLMCCCLHTDKHNDTRPSMLVKITDEGVGGYKCRACGSSGNLYQLINHVAKLHKRDYSKLIAYVKDNSNEFFIADWNSSIKKAKKKLEFSCSPAILPRRFVPILDFENKKVVSQDALRYLRKRGISNQAIKDAQLLYDPYDRRIIFPIIQNDGVCYGSTSRSIVDDDDFPRRKIRHNKQWDFGNKHSEDEVYDATYTDEKGKVHDIVYMKVRDGYKTKKSELLLGMHLWKDGLPVFVVEGLFGYLHLLSIGAGEYFNICATMGAELSDLQAHRLKLYGKPVFFLFDNDEAGIKALLGTEKSLGAIDKLHGSNVVCTPNWPRVNDQELIDYLTPLFLKIKSCSDIKEKKRLKKLVDGYTMTGGGRIYKADPDKLTIEEIKYMKMNAEIV